MALSTRETALILSLVFLFIGLLITALTFWVEYDTCSEELESLKLIEKRNLPAPDSEHHSDKKNTKDADSERIASKIADKEYYCTIYYAASIIPLLVAISLPLSICTLHALLQCGRHYPDIDAEKCVFLRIFSRFSCPCSEDSFSENAQDLRVAYDRTAPDTVVSRTTRNRPEDVIQQPSADLPGVPSTSNN